MESLNKSSIRRIESRLSNQEHDFFLILFIGLFFNHFDSFFKLQNLFDQYKIFI
mgnify:CR=1 FL=1